MVGAPGASGGSTVRIFARTALDVGGVICRGRDGVTVHGGRLISCTLARPAALALGLEAAAGTVVRFRADGSLQDLRFPEPARVAGLSVRYACFGAEGLREVQLAAPAEAGGRSILADWNVRFGADGALADASEPEVVCATICAPTLPSCD